MARLLANLPLLQAGWPPLLVSVEKRRDYLQRMGDYSIARGKPTSGEPLVLPGSERDALASFFTQEWQTSLDLIGAYRARQEARDKE